MTAAAEPTLSPMDLRIMEMKGAIRARAGNRCEVTESTIAGARMCEDGGGRCGNRGDRHPVCEHCSGEGFIFVDEHADKAIMLRAKHAGEWAIACPICAGYRYLVDRPWPVMTFFRIKGEKGGTVPTELILICPACNAVAANKPEAAKRLRISH